MAGVGRMTEPNVLGNISPAKFIFETGNTEILSLWSPTFLSGTYPLSFNRSSAGTLLGVRYQVPVGKVFYLLSLSFAENTATTKLRIQSNTTVDTATGGTTLFTDHILANLAKNYDVCLKFVAGEYITPHNENANDIFCMGWGVECDA